MYYYSIFIGICTEEGLIDDGCFDAALQHVHQTLELVYFPQYLHSAFYAKHQLEAFTSNGGSGITMKGILHNEVLFFHFPSQDEVKTIGQSVACSNSSDDNL